ncbi:MAG: glycosyltransferase [Zoogloeaceae bacterium]|jgi:processive 1,2-diacylglycerol beta-glucosyltransferase|nr:glycosyltransferase [Zoogloeaceae bacterium]
MIRDKSRCKLLVLSVSAGAGHVRAARALCAYALTGERALPAENVRHLDVMDYAPRAFRKLYADSYLKLVQKMPFIWGLLYKSFDRFEHDKLVQRLRRMVERLNTRALSRAIADFAPDVVICTHFLPAEILMHEINRGRFKTPVWVQVTDFDVHRMWVIPHMQGYLVANDEVAFRLGRLGIDPDRVHVTGIPIMPAFAENHDRAACRRDYGLDEQSPVLLLMGGGAGMGDLAAVAETLLEQHPGFQLLVLAGKNAEALADLQALAREKYPQRLFPQGFTDKVETLMACADLAISKPGGLTSSECLAMQLPMIVHSPIPGQEEHNADTLLEQGVALKANDSLGLAWRVRELLAHPEKLRQMRQRARSIRRPTAGRAALDILM